MMPAEEIGMDISALRLMSLDRLKVR